MLRLRLKEKELELSKTFVMGILNVTEDSFYPQSRIGLEKIAEAARKMDEEGADIIDVGAESTRPGSVPVDPGEESRRITEAVREIRKVTDLPISVDTYRSSTAKAGVAAGADLVNDISGLRFDSKMAKTVADLGVPVIVMHIKGTPREMQKNPFYEDVVKEVREELERSVETALRAGIGEDMIIVDPGIGFGKRLEDNLKLIAHLDEFKTMKKPILIGLSRKSTIDGIMKMDVGERLEPTIALNTVSVMKGADIVRVHDVYAHVKAMRMVDAVMGVK